VEKYVRILIAAGSYFTVNNIRLTGSVDLFLVCAYPFWWKFLLLQAYSHITRRHNYFLCEFPHTHFSASAPESLANAKASARQQAVYELWRPLTKKTTANQRKEHNVEKYIQWVTTLSLTIRVYLYLCSFSRCWVPTLRNSPKIRTYSSSRSSNVIDLSANRKRICDFLLVINRGVSSCSSLRGQLGGHICVWGAKNSGWHSVWLMSEWVV